MSGLEFAIIIGVLLMSIIIHEVSHGYAAYRLGDPTAKEAGRLTLNPLAHIDPIGSIVVPLVFYFAGGLIFGWAKPVPIELKNFKNPKKDFGIVGAAGPLSNMLLAVFFGFILRLGSGANFLSPLVAQALIIIVVINILLTVFNLIPIPPLDGSRILYALLPVRWYQKIIILERYPVFMIMIVFALIFHFQGLIKLVILTLFNIITGIDLTLF